MLASIDFTLGKPPIELADDEIHLWLFPQCSVSSSTANNHERSLRNLLGAYLHMPPDAVNFARDTHGKPFLVDLPKGVNLHFNLSHAGALLLIGLSRRQSLGVDLEASQRTRPWLELAQRFFAPTETTSLRDLPPSRLGTAFTQLWSCKEAVLKALGRGIAFGLHRLEFALDAEGTVLALLHIDPDGGSADRWHLARLAPDVGVIGAVAWQGPRHTLRAFRVHSD